MGLAWATANLLGLPFADFSTMVAVHGALNTLGVAIGVLALREFVS